MKFAICCTSITLTGVKSVSNEWVGFQYVIWRFSLLALGEMSIVRNERSFDVLTSIDWLVYWISENSQDNYWYVSRVSILYQNNDVYSDVTCPWSPKHIISQSFIIHIRSWQAVTTITNDISTSAVTRSITREEKECTLQLMCLSFSTHWNLILPSSFSLGSTKFGNFSRNITRWNGVWACESYPFYCERFACMILVYRISQDK